MGRRSMVGTNWLLMLLRVCSIMMLMLRWLLVKRWSKLLWVMLLVSIV